MHRYSFKGKIASVQKDSSREKELNELDEVKPPLNHLSLSLDTFERERMLKGRCVWDGEDLKIHNFEWSKLTCHPRLVPCTHNFRWNAQLIPRLYTYQEHIFFLNNGANIKDNVLNSEWIKPHTTTTTTITITTTYFLVNLKVTECEKPKVTVSVQAAHAHFIDLRKIKNSDVTA